MPPLSVGERSGPVVRLVDVRTLYLAGVESSTVVGDDPTAEPARPSNIVPSLEAIPSPGQGASLAKPARASAAAAGSHVVRVVPAAHRGTTFRPAPEVLTPVAPVSALSELTAS